MGQQCSYLIIPNHAPTIKNIFAEKTIENVLVMTCVGFTYITDTIQRDNGESEKKLESLLSFEICRSHGWITLIINLKTVRDTHKVPLICPCTAHTCIVSYFDDSKVKNKSLKKPSVFLVLFLKLKVCVGRLGKEKLKTCLHWPQAMQKNKQKKKKSNLMLNSHLI